MCVWCWDGLLSNHLKDLQLHNPSCCTLQLHELLVFFFVLLFDEFLCKKISNIEYRMIKAAYARGGNHTLQVQLSHCKAATLLVASSVLQSDICENSLWIPQRDKAGQYWGVKATWSWICAKTLFCVAQRQWNETTAAAEKRWVHEERVRLDLG